MLEFDRNLVFLSCHCMDSFVQILSGEGLLLQALAKGLGKDGLI